ncbi:MAG: ADP-ribosylglycohydrolase family protein [Clostridia bacterium]|nr:ADP-ribosylglycohydrolase family protein [Clostridia bacterium]
MKKLWGIMFVLLAFGAAFALSAFAADVVFVADGGKGDGSRADAPLSTLEAAAGKLPTGGTVVVCGQLSLVNSVCPAYGGQITVTSVYDGVDYRRTNGAKMIFADKNANPISLGGDTLFDHIILEVRDNRARAITGNGNKIVFGSDVESMRADASYQWLGITLGAFDDKYAICDATRGGSLTINGGAWQIIRGGNRGAATAVRGDVSITVGGGIFEGNLLFASAAPIDGSVSLTVSGGTFKGTAASPLSITSSSAEKAAIGGDVNIEISGGSFSNVALTVAKADSVGGKATVTLNGGSFRNSTLSVGAYSKGATLNYNAASFGDISFVDPNGFTVNKTGSPVTPAAQKPQTSGAYGCARGLYTLGLAQGYDSTGTNFGLTDSITRIQTVVQVIRFLGKEAEVKAGSYKHPFTDVPAWANNYVGYAYETKITSGRSATLFDPDGAVDEMQFLTFMLRAIGYSDAKGDFVWNDPFAFAKQVGIENGGGASAFVRGDAFCISWDALYATAENGKAVYENLIAAGVFTAGALTAAQTAATETAGLSAPLLTTLKAAPVENIDDYYVLSKADYMDKTTAGFLGQIIGFLSDYKYVWNKNGTPRVALPEEWWLGICRGNDVAGNPYHSKIIKLYRNDETQMWEDWIADAFSIDILGQHILRDMRQNYGAFTTKGITDGWVKYAPWDMGGGGRFNGAYALASKKGYISPYLGMAEYGNAYPWCQEPWIGNDGLGMAAAGMPNTALELTRAFGRVTGDSDNVRWLDFVAAMSSMAYFESDIKTLIDTACDVFPADAYERKVVEMCYELHARYKTNWRHAILAAEEECARRFYYLHTGRSTNAQGRCEVNFAFMVLALLYGEGDYMETAKILSLCGYDTRGTIMLPVLGIIGGMSVIPEEAKAVTWQDGKGMIVNKAVPDTENGVWMFADGLPERYSIASVIDLYRENFEWLLVENGGKIEGDNYYIPKTKLKTFDSVSVKNGDFEDGKLEGYSALGNAAAVSVTDFAYWGDFAARVETDKQIDGGVYTTVSGLIPGETYRFSAYVLAASGAAAKLFARAPGAASMQTAGVYYQPEYVKRDLVFVATGERMEIGLCVPAQDAYGYVVIDEIEVCRIEEYKVDGAGDVRILSAPSAANRYDGRIDFAIDGKADGQVRLKVYFANTGGGIVDGAITVNGDNFRTVPFYKTGADVRDGAADCVYIPILLQKDSNTVSIDLGGASLYVSAVQLVTVCDRLK